MKTAEFITAAIPDSIRMGTHDDEKLLFSVLVSVLKTYHENASSWDKTIARHIHEALTRAYGESIQPHIATEESIMGDMRGEVERHKAKAEEYRGMIEPDPVYYRIVNGKVRPSVGTITLAKEGAGGIVTYRDGHGATGDGVYTSDSDLVAAVDEAIRDAGFVPFLVGSVT